MYFGGKANKRSTTNIPATLTSTGLAAREAGSLALTDFGKRVAHASSAREAAQVFCQELIKNQSGMTVIEAIRELTLRRVPVTKKSLKAELKRLGITNLSTNTTDHTTLKNWMVAAGIVKEPAKQHPEIDDGVLKKLVGVSSEERDELGQLSPAQHVFLEFLRKRHISEPGPFLAKDLLQVCLESYPHLFSEDQFARAVRMPLEAGGWITVSDLAPGRQGGKSGRVLGTPKLLGIPEDQVITDFSSTVPSDLRARIRTPLAAILKDLESKARTHVAGIALELLALKMILDLGLEPRHFRLRSRESAFAEVDVTAEGRHLLFSRWSFQCKNIGKNTKVGLSDVAKEVGIAVYTKAHVVVMVTTSDFSADAYDYAREVTKATHLQFLFIPGTVVRKYVRDGAGALRAFVLENASDVMAQKRFQPL